MAESDLAGERLERARGEAAQVEDDVGEALVGGIKVGRRGMAGATLLGSARTEPEEEEGEGKKDRAPRGIRTRSRGGRGSPDGRHV